MARTEGTWQKGIGYISPSEDVPVLLRNTYLNFGGSVIGSSGYGFRDNSGVMEWKSSGGAWNSFIAGAGSYKITVSTTAPSSPVVNDLWVDTN